MPILSYSVLESYWSLPMIEINTVVFLNLLGSLILGLILGYERSYHGRAAGMKTYGLVCLASTAIVVIVGYPEYWFDAHKDAEDFTRVAPDATRVIQGIVTGIGFLGAGVIFKSSFTISGLSTAASIWTASAIGILVGVGFYFSAILLTLLSAMTMMWGPQLETILPSRYAIAVSLTYKTGCDPNHLLLTELFLSCGYEMSDSSLAIKLHNGNENWSFQATSLKKIPRDNMTKLSKILARHAEIENYSVAFARN